MSYSTALCFYQAHVRIPTRTCFVRCSKAQWLYTSRKKSYSCILLLFTHIIISLGKRSCNLDVFATRVHRIQWVIQLAKWHKSSMRHCPCRLLLHILVFSCSLTLFLRAFQPSDSGCPYRTDCPDCEGSHIISVSFLSDMLGVLVWRKTGVLYMYCAQFVQFTHACVWRHLRAYNCIDKLKTFKI